VRSMYAASLGRDGAVIRENPGASFVRIRTNTSRPERARARVRSLLLLLRPRRAQPGSVGASEARPATARAT